MSADRTVLSDIRRSGAGIAGLAILSVLACVSVLAVLLVPAETFSVWNDPGSWIALPKAAVPAWTNWLGAESIPEHMVLGPVRESVHDGDITVSSHKFAVRFDYDAPPSDFIYEYTAVYSGSPLLQISAVRPDGERLVLVSKSLPAADSTASHSERIFSSDAAISKGLLLSGHAPRAGLQSEDVVFSGPGADSVLRGDYVFVASLYGTGGAAELADSALVLGGGAFGLMGTDELRRDLAVGLVLGTPLALFIGVTVAAGSVTAGLLYGVYAGYRGGVTDGAMMRINDVVYALPALPFLIILAVMISSSIFVMVGFLMMFGWVGVAKVSRSMALQIKTSGYVEASYMMGQGSRAIMIKHILPQLLPYAFASIAISVPAAITTEAGLSFLGLGDPVFPTWGSMLHDANSHGAAARGMWWWIVPPGVMIALTGLAFVLIGNALDAAVNPRLRR